MQLKELPTLKVFPGFTGISKRSRFYTTGCGWCYRQLQVGAKGQTCDLHLRFLLDFIGAYRFRIYTTLGSYGVSQANTAAGSTRQFQDLHLGFTGKYRCRIYNAVTRSTLQVSQGLTGIIRGSETTLQIAKSYKHLQDRADRVKTKKKEQQQEN